MAFTVQEFRDLIQILEQHPEWRAELRRLVLTEELLTLPQIVRQLVDGVTRPVVAPAGAPGSFGQVIQVLAVNEDKGTHGKKHPPGGVDEPQSSRRGANQFQ